MNRLTVDLLLIVSLLSQGCIVFSPPDTFRDMWQQVDAVEVPGSWLLVEKHADGTRWSFWPSGPPEVTYSYSAPWDAGKLCDRIRRVAGHASLIMPAWDDTPLQAGARCDYKTRIAAGWRAWPVNVWSYVLRVTAIPPDHVNSFSADECARIREKKANSPYPNDYVQFGPCWVRPGEALVTVEVVGGEGWLLPPS